MTGKQRPEPSITCPRCGRMSYNPNDVAHGYCGACHDYTSGAPGSVTDLVVRCGNPEALDRTVQQLGPAYVVEDSWNGETCRVRVRGPAGYIRFAIDHQGYGEVLAEGPAT